MKTAMIQVETITLPTYPEPEREELPIFAENRVHQRAAGNPYPNRVVMEVNRTKKENRSYIAVHMENEFLDLLILPEIGGRIYSAKDKTTGYDFFYKQHVIKPALIGALGSWISGGVEFNWPYHHRPSGFSPCDYSIEKQEDGTVICWLSEHDPVDRMKSLLGIVLRPDSVFFETRVKLCNRTPLRKSFLWWENAAVPVNESYQIFFPPDVTYVNFHYHDSRISYPIAGGGVYNGIDMASPRDISWHKNTKDATSYFACASKYDFFGGYDHNRGCGVVHIGNHHISPGKKMFTWAYNQLSRSWENALTDSDGQYAELMAGSYTDNQPDFTWLAPYETKEFSQYWYPISALGTPDFANLNCAFRLGGDTFSLMATKDFGKCRVQIFRETHLLLDEPVHLSAGKTVSLPILPSPGLSTVVITDPTGKKLAFYQEETPDLLSMPPVKKAMAPANEFSSADDLYLAGIHIKQYRDPVLDPESYWLEALKRNPCHIPSLTAMAEQSLSLGRLAEAETYAQKAISLLTRFNAHPESGEIFYLYGLILEKLGRENEAYDSFYKASWDQSSLAKSMTRIAFLDLKRKDYETAIFHSRKVLQADAFHPAAHSALILGLYRLGQAEEAENIAANFLRHDPLNSLVRFLKAPEDETFYREIHSPASQLILDLAFDLDSMGQEDLILTLFNGFQRYRKEDCSAMVLYAKAYYENRKFGSCAASLEAAEKAPIGSAYPSRTEEIAPLSFAASQGSNRAAFLLGCLLYSKKHYEESAAKFEEAISFNPENYMAFRSLAIVYFSHLGRKNTALSLMETALSLKRSPQLLYETILLMNKLGIAPKKKLEFLQENSDLICRDDLSIELARALNQYRQPKKALEVMASRTFVPCEGGEHSIADQYMLSWLLLGLEQKKQKNYEEALLCFQTALTLPENLGAGIWNRCKYVPWLYESACCLEYLNRLEEARQIFEEILSIEEDFFSRMHLKELPYFKAMAAKKLERKQQGDRIMTAAKRQWLEELSRTDSGFFSTTPFFISFTDDPASMRKAQYTYLLAFISLYEGNFTLAQRHFEESWNLDGNLLLSNVLSDMENLLAF